MRTILVLGGGGVKGMTHVGAWRALTEAGVSVDAIVGTSIGALVGAAVAAGEGAESLTRRALALARADIVALNRWALLLNGVRQPSLFHGEPLRGYIAKVLPAKSFGDLRIPLSLNAVELGSGRMVWFGAGGRADVPLVDAVYASCALPLFYPPAELDDGFYVDGGVLDALPLTRAAELGADRIISIDAGSGGERNAATVIENGLVGIHHRVFEMMANQRKAARLAAWSGPPVIHVRPRLDGYSTFDFEATSYFLDEGYRATRAALETAGIAFPPAEREA